jgi:hypothetical protein
MTADQIRRLSQTWTEPIHSVRRTRALLLTLARHRLVRVHVYASTRLGQPENYYTLAPQGYWLLHGPDAPQPTKAHVSPVSISRQEHTRSLADAIVQIHLMAHTEGASLSEFYRENALRLELAGDFLAPDASFTLVDQAGKEFQFHVELDMGTERIRSTRTDQSLEAKLRFYDRWATVQARRFRVLFLVASDSAARRDRILQAFHDLTTNRLRTLVYAATLQDLLQTTSMHAPVFHDHRGRVHSLYPPLRARQEDPNLLQEAIVY